MYMAYDNLDAAIGGFGPGDARRPTPCGDNARHQAAEHA
jgi:hypothetical protein